MHDTLGRILRHLQAELRGALVRAIQALDGQGCGLGRRRVADHQCLTAGRPERHGASTEAEGLHREAAAANGAGAWCSGRLLALFVAAKQIYMELLHHSTPE